MFVPFVNWALMRVDVELAPYTQDAPPDAQALAGFMKTGLVLSARLADAAIFSKVAPILKGSSLIGVLRNYGLGAGIFGIVVFSNAYLYVKERYTVQRLQH